MMKKAVTLIIVIIILIPFVFADTYTTDPAFYVKQNETKLFFTENMIHDPERQIQDHHQRISSVRTAARGSPPAGN